MIPRRETWLHPVSKRRAVIEIEIHRTGEIVSVTYELFQQMVTALGFERETPSEDA